MGLLFWGLIALGILVTVHEGGHFIVAKLLGVKVEKFSIGFGPKIVSFTRGDTEYRISLLPLGGYVKMKGETPLDETTGATDEFLNKKWWEKALIAFAGPFANFILAIILFTISFTIGQKYEDFEPIIGKISQPNITSFQLNDTITSINNEPIKSWNQMFQHFKESNNSFQILRNGQAVTVFTDTLSINTFANNIQPQTSTIIGSVSPGYPAYLAGLKKGDKIIKVNEIDVKDWYELRNQISNSEEKSVQITLLRDDKVITKTMNLSDNILEKGSKIIGITQHLPLEIEEKFPLFTSMKYGLVTSITTIYANYYGMAKLIKNPSALKENVGGPVMMVTISKQYSEKGISSILSFLAIINILLLVMNLLPIPILDGGQIVFSFIEGIKGSPLSIKIQSMLQQAGLVLLLTLTIYVFFNDFSRINQRFKSIKSTEESIVK